MNKKHCHLVTLVLRTVLVAGSILLLPTIGAYAQPAGGRPSPGQINAGRSQPAYPVQYEPASVEQITEVLDRVHAYLEENSPAMLINRETRQAITDYSRIDENTTLQNGAFRPVSYEWGVTYAGMLLAAEATGDQRFKDYTARRLQFVAEVAPYYRAQADANPRNFRNPFRSVLAPRSLDDSGSMAAAMIKAHRAGIEGNLRPLIDNYLNYISNGQKRLADGTLARDRPLPDSLWLDDLYMSVPALAQMGALTGERKYFDDAVKQIGQFAGRMFVPEKGLYMHAWISAMEPHRAFHWGRANGWAIVAKTELLSVLPEDHPGRRQVMDLYKAHIAGLAAVQGIDGLWHQLLDRPETYEETSASAMFAYCIARGINQGWLDRLAYGPVASAAWNAVAAQVNEQGQVEGTCVGTGMGFEPMFYAYRPTSVFAAHGYGPVLLAGAEMITLRKGKGSEAQVSDGAVQFEPSPSRF